MYKCAIKQLICLNLFIPLQGWQRKLDPDYNVMKTLQTLLFKEDWAKSLQYTIEGLMAP
jgi:aarF domain-containing kinase